MAAVLGSWAAHLGMGDDRPRLVLSFLAGYPLALIHRSFLKGSSPLVQNLFFAASGLGIYLFLLGSDAIYSLLSILVTYALLRILGGTSHAIGTVFVFNMVFYLGGCFIDSEDQLFRWTFAQSALVLRLIGVAFDVSDGKKNPEKLSEENKKTAIPNMPSLLEMLGYSYFFGCCLVGPVLPIRRYQDFVNGKFSDKLMEANPPSMPAGLKRLGLGITCLLLLGVGTHYFPSSFMLSTEFQELSFLWRCIYILFWGKVAIYKYVAMWLVVEGSCTIVGISYNGTDKDGTDLWNACANIKFSKYELYTSVSELVGSFHITANKWMGQYIFKRLRWLGNKAASHIITMTFLAVWHGFYPGYYIFFLTEFLGVQFEGAVSRIIGRIRVLSRLVANPMLSPVIWFCKRFYAQMATSYAFVAFNLLTIKKAVHVYSAVHWFVHILFVSVIVLGSVVPVIIPKSSGKDKEATQNTQKAQKAE